jgi:hypothetical protein
VKKNLPLVFGVGISNLSARQRRRDRFSGGMREGSGYLCCEEGLHGHATVKGLPIDGRLLGRRVRGDKGGGIRLVYRRYMTRQYACKTL